MNRDLTCLAEGAVFPTAQEMTGINGNQIVVGPTRSGKTMSVVEPRLLHTFDSSVIVNLTKRKLVDQYAPVFAARGYEVWDLNFASPEKSTIAYDPFFYVTSEKEAMKLAQTLIGSDVSRAQNGAIDPYWNESGISALAAIIGLVLLNAEDAGKRASFQDFFQLYSYLKFDPESNVAKSNIDIFFDAAEDRHPETQIGRLWNTVRGNSPKTAACIISIMNNAIDKILTKEVVKMTQGEKQVSFAEMGTKKVALFLTTSPVNKSMQKLTNLFFADAFRNLFEFAETCPNYELPVPVHLICDDFATGSKIPDFHEYLSVFCAMRISVTLLLQSESQLEAMYGKTDATTIINNCDTYLYIGGMDDTTCYNISRRLNCPVEDVFAQPLEQVVLFRRGAKPYKARRYQTLEDPLYKELVLGEKRARRTEKAEKETSVA